MNSYQRASTNLISSSLMPVNPLPGRYSTNDDTIYLTGAALADKVSGDLSSSAIVAGLWEGTKT